MIVQPLGSFYQIQNSIKTEFQNLRQNFGQYVGAISKANQDQVTSSQNGVQQALAQFQTDLNSLQSANPGNQNLDSTQKDFQNILVSVHSAVKAIKSGNQEQITSSQNALQQALAQFQTTLSNIQQPSGGLDKNAAQADFQNLVGAINSLLAAHQSGNQDQIVAAKQAMQKAITQVQTDLPGLQKSKGHSHYDFKGNSADKDTGTHNFSSLLAATKGYGASVQSQPLLRPNGLSLSI